MSQPTAPKVSIHSNEERVCELRALQEHGLSVSSYPRKMHVLFICSLCRLRSPTAKQTFATRKGWEVEAAGVEQGADRPVTAKLIDWADTIFVMAESHREKLIMNFSVHIQGKRIFCLGIPDKYDYMDPKLVRALKRKVPKLLAGG